LLTIGGVIIRALENALEDELPPLPREDFNEEYQEEMGKKLSLDIIHHTTLPKVYARFADFILDPLKPMVLKEGVVVTKRGLYITSLNIEPDEIIYVKLANTLSSNTDTVELNESKILTKLELYFEAIELNPEDPFAYFHLALSLSDEKEQEQLVTLKDGEIFTKLELLLKVIELDSSHWEACYEIASHVIPSSETSVVTRKGKRIHKLKYFILTLHLNPNHALAYYELAMLVTEKKEVKFRNQKIWNRRELLVRSVSLDPTLIMAYYHLALTLQQPDDTLTLGIDPSVEVVYSQRDLFFLVLRDKPTFAEVYYRLACGVSKDDSIPLALSSTHHTVESSSPLDDTEGIVLSAPPTHQMTHPPPTLPQPMMLFPPPHPLSRHTFIDRRDLCLLALEYDPSHARAYDKLASTLTSDDETVQLLNGHTVTKRDLYLLSVQHDPSFSRGYYNLARKMNWKDQVTLPDNTTLSTKDLYLKAIEHNRHCAEAYNNLAILLPTRDMKIRLPDGLYASRKELLMLAIRLNPSYLPAYYNLSNTLGTLNESVTLSDGRVLSGKYLQELGSNSFNLQSQLHQQSSIEQLSIWDQ
jgi:tetratricopeptide (TPR) repeat protein